MEDLKEKAAALRRMIIELSCQTRTSHLGSALSCADILLAAYNGGLRISPEEASHPERDRLVFSKGHWRPCPCVRAVAAGLLYV